MLAIDLEPIEIIVRDPEKGFFRIGPNRIMAVNIFTLGRFIKDISHLVDFETRHTILTRMGVELGMLQAFTLSDLYNFDSKEEWLKAGTSLRTITGYASESIESLTFDANNRLNEFKVSWEDSFESVAHREFYGKGAEHVLSLTPVCSVLAGMVGGYASVVYNEEIMVCETDCQAQGYEACLSEGRPLRLWGDDARDRYHSPQTVSFEKRLGQIRKHYEKTKSEVLSLKAKSSDIRPIQTAKNADEASTAGIVYRCNKMKERLDLARKVAPTEATVLISGESGTGKEVFARYIHTLSHKKTNPFVAINCAALPPALLESELFGYVKGAFTGADSDKNGLFIEAGNGTIFLDEIGELPLELQAKLLRVLQQKEVRPVGGLRDMPFQARIIAATNQDLKKAIADKRFRPDLYYRLAVFPIKIPSLRERREDVVLLARHFLKKISPENKGIDPNALSIIEKHNWPGNVRELENWIEYAVIMADGEKIQPSHFPEEITEDQSFNVEAFPDSLPTYEEMGFNYIRHVLSVTGNNKKEAARILNIGTATLWRHLKKDQTNSDAE